jgi:Zn-dependent protease with chaperone function
MTKIVGKYFSGRSSHPLEALLILTAGEIRIELPHATINYGPKDFLLCPRPAANVLAFDFSDGAKFETQAASDSLDLRHLDRDPQVFCERHWKWCVGGLLAIGGAVLLFFWQFLPIVALGIAKRLPASVERQISQDFLRAVEPVGNQASAGLRQKVAPVIQELGPVLRDRQIMVRACCSKSDVANAFALPNGVIILTDRLVRELTPDEIKAVLLHELGHVYFHHPTQMLIEDQVASAAIILLAGYGDAYGWGAKLLSLGNSREHEKQADLFAANELKRRHLTPHLLVAALDHLERLQPAQAGFAVNWVSTHPITSQRRQYLNELSPMRRRTCSFADPDRVRECLFEIRTYSNSTCDAKRFHDFERTHLISRQQPFSLAHHE